MSGTVLFIAENLNGIGHVARTIAIGRRLKRKRGIILSTCRAVHHAADFGLHPEHFPDPITSNCEPAKWNEWLAVRIDMLCRSFGVDVIAFDGNFPYSGVLSAIDGRRDVRSLWIRRGLWADTPQDRQNMKAAAAFDEIIEPSDFAESIDSGPASRSSLPVRKFPPVLLVDPAEAPARGKACEALGISAGDTNILVQLGSGNNRDVSMVLDAVGALAERHPGVQLFMAKNPLSQAVAGYSPRLRLISAFPMAYYYNAFDFAVSAAGYNSYHEVLFGRLPTIFIPNERKDMDNQPGRAAFAVEKGLARCAKPNAGSVVAEMEHMLRPAARAKIAKALSRMRLRNGAQPIADHLDSL